MGFHVTFSRYRPSGRTDGIKWTQISIQEAAWSSDTGEPSGFSEIETKTIPDYLDPAEPPYLTFATENGTQQPGWYKIVFRSVIDEEETAPQLFRGGTYLPGTRDVALYIKNRTVDAHNQYLGDFTDETEVTKEEVEDLIKKARETVLTNFDQDPNVPIPTESQQSITNLISLYAAMLVELTKYSEQVATRISPYEQLKQLYDEQLLAIQKDLGLIIEEVNGTISGAGIAYYSFDEDIGGQVGWSTQF